MIISELIQNLDNWAPFQYQENYDNSGLLIGNLNSKVTGVLINVDFNIDLIDECIKLNINTIITHHPLIFKGMKRVVSGHWQSDSIIKAIKHDINIISIHTNLDNVSHGVNLMIGNKLGLKNLKILEPKSRNFRKLFTYVPSRNTSEVLQALFDSGAGHIGFYSDCSFRVNGIGTFRPLEGSNPYIGNVATGREEISEDKIELIYPIYLENAILKTLQATHPYEEIAYDLIQLENISHDIGSGMMGDLSAPISYDTIFDLIKETFNMPFVRHTQTPSKLVSKIAFCGGSGSFLLQRAIDSGADLFLSADFKYHDFFEAGNSLCIADIGHYEIEQFTSELIYDFLSKKSFNFALHLSRINTNPIKYYL